VFSIDGHRLKVVEADFVPITPYTTESVLVGIGQRYHVIVEASPHEPTADGNYWIRTIPATTCGSFKFPYTVQNATTGIVRYDFTSTTLPTSRNLTFPIDCSDEPYEKLSPILEWTVPETEISDEMDVTLVNANTTPYYPQYPDEDGFRRWQMFKGPLWLNFSDPTILNTDGSSSIFLSQLTVNTKFSKRDQWVELLITGPPETSRFAAHPIHLHGHDFALLSQGNTTFNASTAVIKRDNPPRRDVALLPRSGYLLIAFKVDNPGMYNPLIPTIHAN
jgi:FtsP/CotA-like multicopper oxidase with cupredoxin domain